MTTPRPSITSPPLPPPATTTPPPPPAITPPAITSPPAVSPPPVQQPPPLLTPLLQRDVALRADQPYLAYTSSILLEAFTHDGTPLHTRRLRDAAGQEDAKLAAAIREMKRRKADGTWFGQPARAAAKATSGKLCPDRKPRFHPVPAAVVNDPKHCSTPHPNDLKKKRKCGDWVAHESLIVMNDDLLEGVTTPSYEFGGLGSSPIMPLASGPDLQVVRVMSEDGKRILLTVVYVRMKGKDGSPSPYWRLTDAELDAAIESTVQRVETRPDGTDNAITSTSPSGGVYVDTGATDLPQATPTDTLPRGSRVVRSLSDDSSPHFLRERTRLLEQVRCPSVARAHTAAAATSGAAASDDDAMSDDGDAASNAASLSAYECKRLENIRNNAAELDARGLRDALGLAADATERDVHHRLAYMAPYRHMNGREQAVREVAAATARAMAAGAEAVRACAPEVYDAWWAPIEAAPVVAPAFIYPSPAMQRGEVAEEWAAPDCLPAAGDVATCPTQHLASRVSGIPDDADASQIRRAWCGVSNAHYDPIDAWRKFGVPIVYVPRISDAARRNRRYVKSHPLPSSDLVWCEGKRGGRAFRIRTCTDGVHLCNRTRVPFGLIALVPHCL